MDFWATMFLWRILPKELKISQEQNLRVWSKMLPPTCLIEPKISWTFHKMLKSTPMTRCGKVNLFDFLILADFDRAISEIKP